MVEKIVAWIIITGLIGIGIWDIWRVVKKQKTISHIIQEWCPKKLDYVVMVIGVVLFWWLLGGEVAFAKGMMLFLLIHFFWPKD